MNGRRLCYVAGPFGGHGDTLTARKAQEEINVNRACFVGYILWKHRNYAPVVPHAIGTMVYGDDHDADVRRMSIDAGVAMAHGVGRAGGSFFALRRDDGIISEGTGRELMAWQHTYSARRALGLESANINWDTLPLAPKDDWSANVDNDKLTGQHLIWIGTFPRFLDAFTMSDDWRLWELHHGYGSLGDKGNR